MTEDGFTLTEMLVALVMAGLATTGVALTVQTLAAADGRAHANRLEAADLTRLKNSVQSMQRLSGPFQTDFAEGPFAGSVNRASFACGQNACSLMLTEMEGVFAVEIYGGERGAKLSLRGVDHPEFHYVSAFDGRQERAWPPADRPDRLAAIVLMDGATPLQVIRIRREQPVACVFDARSKGCGAAR